MKSHIFRIAVTSHRLVRPRVVSAGPRRFVRGRINSGSNCFGAGSGRFEPAASLRGGVESVRAARIDSAWRRVASSRESVRGGVESFRHWAALGALTCTRTLGSG